MRLALADSFLATASDASVIVRGFDLHCDRFLQGLGDLGAEHSPEVCAGWLDEIRQYTLAHGQAFPRFEYWADSDDALRLALRPAPQLTTSLSFAAVQVADDRYLSRHKGPGIEHHQSLIRHHGGEVLLTTPEGHVLEGTSTSVIWWQDGTLMRVADAEHRVCSVTEHLVAQLAEELGTPVATGQITADELQHHEVWVLNALHGIRPIHSGKSDRLTRFQDAYAATARPV